MLRSCTSSSILRDSDSALAAWAILFAALVILLAAPVNRLTELARSSLSGCKSSVLGVFRVCSSLPWLRSSEVESAAVSRGEYDAPGDAEVGEIFGGDNESRYAVLMGFSLK